MSDCDQSRHVQRAPQPPIAKFAQPGPPLDAGAGAVMPGIQAAVSHPLACVQGAGQHGQFAEQLQRASFSDPRRGLLGAGSGEPGQRLC